MYGRTNRSYFCENRGELQMAKTIDINITNVARKFADSVRRENFAFREIYLFGSYAKNCPQKDSDIDIAIVTENSDTIFFDELKLTKLRRNIDNRIEPHIIDKSMLDTPFAREVFATGIKIA